MDTNTKIKLLLKEEQKQKNREYAKTYYQAHKGELIERGCKKVICENCGRCVIKNNLRVHQTYNICQIYSQLKKRVEELEQA